MNQLILVLLVLVTCATAQNLGFGAQGGVAQQTEVVAQDASRSELSAADRRALRQEARLERRARREAVSSLSASLCAFTVCQHAGVMICLSQFLHSSITHVASYINCVRVSTQ